MLPINREDLETLKRLPAIRFGCKTVQHKATQSLLCGAKRNNGAVPQSRANLSHRYESRPLQQRVQLSGAEKNAIRFLVVLTGLLEFKSLYRADVLTFASVVLVIVGMVIFDRPFRFVLEVVGVLAWSTAFVLFGLYGGTHMRKLRLASGPKRAD